MTGGVGNAELGQEAEEDGKYAEIEDDTMKARETVAEREEQAVYQLIADAVMAQRLEALCQLDSDGWSLCNFEDALSDESSDFELV